MYHECLLVHVRPLDNFFLLLCLILSKRQLTVFVGFLSLLGKSENKTVSSFSSVTVDIFNFASFRKIISDILTDHFLKGNNEVAIQMISRDTEN